METRWQKGSMTSALRAAVKLVAEWRKPYYVQITAGGWEVGNSKPHRSDFFEVAVNGRITEHGEDWDNGDGAKERGFYPFSRPYVLGMGQHPDMARLGPKAWAELHAWADKLKAQVGDSCGCGLFAVGGMRAFHDVVNHHLGKPVRYPADLAHMAAEFQKAAGGIAGVQSREASHNGGHNSLAVVGLSMAGLVDGESRHHGVTLSQAFMERVMAIPREQSAFDLFPKGQLSFDPTLLLRPKITLPASTSKLKLYPFQAEGAAWLKKRETALLADDMGVGKTPQAIAWAFDRKPVLVVVPAAVQYNWADEIEKWHPGDTVSVLESGEELPKKLLSWTVITYGMVERYLPQLQRAGFKSLVADEAHYIKNLDAKRTKALLQLVAPMELPPGVKPIPSRLAVTGTPITNRPPEIFPLMVFLGKAQRNEEAAFLDHYTMRESAGGKTYFTGYQHLDELHESIRPFTLRRLKRDVLTQLPPKVYRPVYVALTNAAEYHRAETDFLEWLRENVGEQAVERIAFSERAQMLVRLNHLRQLAARGKIKPVADFLRPCGETGHKVLIFSNFLEVLEDLHDQKGGIIYTGATPREERNELVKRFQTSPATCFFFGSIGAAGVGITLTAADRAVFVDLPWTPAAKSQAEDRAHRIGQTKPVEIVAFLARGTVDERIMQLISDKEKIIGQVIDGFDADRASLESVTTQLMGEFMKMAKTGQAPKMPPSYLGDDDEEGDDIQGWNQKPDDYGSRCRDASGAWTFNDLCPPVETIVSRDRVLMVPPASATNRTLALAVDGSRVFEFEYRIVDADKLIPSHNPFTFVENPAFTQSLQPRQRDRAAAEIQVKNIAAKLSPDSLLMDFHTIDRGAPIVGPDMLVESGNGRVMGIQRAIKEHPANYAAYRKALQSYAPVYGLTVGSEAHPVLVRVRLTKFTAQERQAFVLEANAPSGLARSAIEIARTDAEKITLNMLDALDVAEGEDIFDALRAQKNSQFMRLLFGTLPPNEQGDLMDAKGVISMNGVRRAMQAIFVSVFGAGEAGMRLGEMAFESAGQDVRTAINAVASALAPLAKMEAMLRSRPDGSDLSIADDLAAAISVYAKIKKDPALTVAKYLDQMQLESRELSAFGEGILRALDRYRRSAKRMGAVLRAYASLVIDAPPPEQGGLFGPVEPPSRDALWGMAISQTEEAMTEEREERVEKAKRREAVAAGQSSREQAALLVGGKKLWEMTKAEVWKASEVVESGKGATVEIRFPGDEFRRFIYGGDYTTPQKAVWNLHKRRIEAALARGEKVPPEVLADYPDLAKQVVTPTPQPRGSYSSRIRWCNTKPDDQGKVLAWRPLRDLIYIGVGYQVAVEVCEAGFGGGQFQVTIGYPVEGGPRKGHLTSQQLQALRQQAKSFGRLAHEVLTKDTGLLVWDVTLPGPEDTDLALKVQLPGRERDERPSRKQEEAMQPAMFSQTFLDTVLHTALGTAVSIGVAKAMSASVIPPSAPSEPALYVIDEEAEAKKKAEREEAAKRKAASASVLSPSYVEGDQAQVDVGTLLQEIDEILKHPETMGIVDSTTLRIIRG